MNATTPNPSALELAVEAVIYTYPLYEMSRMRVATAARRVEPHGFAGDGPTSPQRWCNVFTHERRLLGPGQSRVVTPNNDTLYTNAWLDLGAGPLVIDVPDTAKRYYVLGLLDFYTNPFAHIGQRLTGTGAAAFLITPPGWQGEVPAAFRQGGRHIQATTRWLWIIGRVLVDGPEDVPAVLALQGGFAIRALDAWLAGGAPAPTRFDARFDAQAPLTAEHFRQVVNAALRDNPPPEAERGVVRRFEAIGIGASCGDAAAPGVTDLLDTAITTALNRLREGADPTEVPGWGRPMQIEASFGTHYQRRALIALKYIGALESREACYSIVYDDAQGVQMNGAHAYRLRFAAGQMPPVNAFWSLTMYDAGDFMLVENPIGRYAIGDRTRGLQHATDGSLTLYLQHLPPADAEARANWLPTPRGDFYLCLRAYWPRPEMLDGRYVPPPIQRVAA